MNRNPVALLTALLLAALASRLPHLPESGFSIDQRQFVLWSMQSVRQGLAAPYLEIPGSRPARRWCNYPPAYLYVLNGVGRLARIWCAPSASDSVQAADHVIDDFIAGRPTAFDGAINTLYKLPAVVADLLTVALLFRWIRPRSRAAALGVAGVYALSPAIWWNSAVWGQVDSIHTLLLLLSLQAAARGWLAPMSGWAALAVLTKAQSLMLAPLWIAALIRPPAGETAGAAGSRGAALVRSAVVAALILVLLAGPFVAGGAGNGVWDSLAGAVGRFPFTHLNGFSAWFLVDPIERSMLGIDPRAYQVDSSGASVLSPRIVGLALLAASAATALVSIVFGRSTMRAIDAAVRLLPLAFFMLPTQIHERYLFPAVALWAWTWRPEGPSASRRWRVAAWWLGWAALHTLVFVNAAWVHSGPPGASWSAWLNGTVHGAFLQRPVGWWCAAAGLALLAILWMHVIAVGRVVRPANPPQPASHAHRERI